MADPEFWARAEIKFRRLQPAPPKRGEVQDASHNGICAWWKQDGWSDGRTYRLFNDGHDSEANKNIERLFRIAAESAAVELGNESGEGAILAWLDLLRLQGLYGTPAGPDSCIIHRVCDASAEYRLKCETRAKAALREASANDACGKEPHQCMMAEIDPFQEDAGGQPLGDNPFPPETSAHNAFEEATWEAKEKIDLLRSGLLADYKTVAELVNAEKPFLIGVDEDPEPPAAVYASPEDELKAIYQAKTGELITLQVLGSIQANLELTNVTMSEFLTEVRKHIQNTWRNPAGFLRDLSKRFRTKTRPAAEPVTAAEAAVRDYQCSTCHSKTPGEGARLINGKVLPCQCASPEWVARQRARGAFSEDPPK